jgi:tRNA(Ser,Leu) C12 N-acetylase TAN1
VKDWNVVVSIYQYGFRRALRALEALAPVARTRYHNVLIMRVEDPIALLATIESSVLEWLPRLAGRTFHVRLHRRGSRRALRSPDVERGLDDALLEGLRNAGTPGTLSFSDPDAVIVIDTIDDRVGISLWTREDLARHRLLRPD